MMKKNLMALALCGALSACVTTTHEKPSQTGTIADIYNTKVASDIDYAVHTTRLAMAANMWNEASDEEKADVEDDYLPVHKIRHGQGDTIVLLRTTNSQGIDKEIKIATRGVSINKDAAVWNVLIDSRNYTLIKQGDAIAISLNMETAEQSFSVKEIESGEGITDYELQGSAKNRSEDTMETFGEIAYETTSPFIFMHIMAISDITSDEHLRTVPFDGAIEMNIIDETAQVEFSDQGSYTVTFRGVTKEYFSWY